MFIYAGGVISWISKKQVVVALSTSEAEYMALSKAAQEAAWLQKLFTDLQLPSEAILIMEDNQGATALAKNPIPHSRTKHIDIRFHFIREVQENDLIDFMYCPTTEMVADLYTKPLPCGQFEKLRALMGMKQLTNRLN